MAVKNVIFQVKADTTQLNKALADAKKQVDELNKAFSETGKGVSTAKYKVATDEVVKQTKRKTQAKKEATKQEAQDDSAALDQYWKNVRKRLEIEKQEAAALRKRREAEQKQQRKITALNDAAKQKEEMAALYQHLGRMDLASKAEEDAAKIRFAIRQSEQRRLTMLSEKQAKAEGAALQRRLGEMDAASKAEAAAKKARYDENMALARSITKADEKRASLASREAQQQARQQIADAKRLAAEQARAARMSAIQQARESRISTRGLDPPNSAWQTFRKTVRDARVILSALFVSSKLIDFGSYIINAAANFEKLNVAFVSFIKYAGDARALLKDLQAYAIKTPFTTEEVQQSARVLLAYGVKTEQIIPTINMLGDVASGTGADLNQMALVFGQIKAAGKLMGQDLLQLVNAGFNPLQEISKRTKVSMATLRKEMEDGKISFDRIQESFYYATSVGGKFYELNEKYSQTLGGRISTLKDNFQLLARAMGQEVAPLARYLTETFIGWTTSLMNGTSFVQRHITAIKYLATAIGLIRILRRQETLEIFRNSLAEKENAILQKTSAAAKTMAAIQLRLLNAWYSQGTIVVRLYKVAQEGLIISFKALKAAIASTGFGLILAFLPEIISYTYDLVNATDDLTDAELRYKRAKEQLPKYEDDATKAGNKAVAAMYEQQQAIEKTTASTQDRKDAIDKFINSYEKFFKTDSKAAKALKDGTALKMKDADLMVTMKKLYSEIAEKINVEAYNLEVDNKIRDANNKLAEDKNALKDYEIKQGPKLIAYLREYQKQTGIAKESGKWLSMDFLNAKKNYETFRDIFADQTTVFQNTIEQDQKNILETKKLYKEYEDEITQPIGDGKGLDGYFKGTKDAWEDLFQTARSNYREILKILSTTPKTDITGTLLNEQADYYKSVAELQQEAYVREFGFKEKQKELQRNYINKVLEINAETTISEDKKRKKIKAAGEQLEIDLQNIDDKIWANDKTLTSSLELLWLNHFNNRKKIQLEYERSIRQSVNDRNIQNAKQVVADQERAAKITDKNEELFSNFVENAKTGRQFKNAKKRLKLTWQEQIDNLYITTKSKEAQLRLEQRANDELLRQQNATDKQRENAWNDYNNQIANLNADAAQQQQFMMLDQNQKLTDINKKHRDAILDGWKQLIGDIGNLASQTLDSYISVVDAQLNAHQRAYDRAKEIADKGNAVLLEQEEKRLQKLNDKRRRFANAQKAIIQTQVIAESALAVAKAAGETGPGAPFAIASTIIALIAGFASAKAAADSAMAEGSYAKGGYTGDGGKYQEAGTVHKGEFVFNKETTQKHRTLFENIHKGRDPYLAMQMNGNAVIFDNKGVESRLDRIEKAIMGQQGMRVSIDENGIHGIVSRIDYKQNRIRNQAR